MTTLTSLERRALEYVRNTDGNVTIAGFDDDHEPIGPRLRARIMPEYVVAGAHGKLFVTRAALALLATPAS